MLFSTFIATISITQIKQNKYITNFYEREIILGH